MRSSVPAPCGGSHSYAPRDGMRFTDGQNRSWTGVCPVCGGRFELGYGGTLPLHEQSPPEPDSEVPLGPLDRPSARARVKAPTR